MYILNKGISWFKIFILENNGNDVNGMTWPWAIYISPILALINKIFNIYVANPDTPCVQLKKRVAMNSLHHRRSHPPRVRQPL